MSDGPVSFIENVLSFRGKPFRLFPFQRRIAEETNFLRDKIVVRAGRQTGKSLLVAALIVYYIATSPYVTCIILSKTKDQAGLISQYVRDFIETSPLLSRRIDKKRTTVLDLYLKNKSKVITRSVGMMKADTLRGHSLSSNGMLCIDEASFCPSEAIKNSLYMASGNCGVVMVSTPYRKAGAFFDACNSSRYKQYHIPCSQSPRITADDIVFWRSSMSANKFANEVLGEFAQGEDSVFAAEIIDSSIDANLPTKGPFKGDPERSYIYSLDVSRIGSDAWVLTIGHIDSGNLSIVAHHSWVGSESEIESEGATVTDDPDSIMSDIVSYHRDRGFPCVKCYVDTTSNEYFAHVLANKYLMPVEPCVWSTSRKEKLISNLETCMSAGRLKLPNVDDLRSQLLAYSFDFKRMADHEQRKLYLSASDGDDWVSSLAMIAQAVAVRKTIDFKDRLIWM